MDVNVKEVKIEAPWGHIAGKTWGDPSTRPVVLTFHGIMDNASSFNRLVDLLPGRYCYASIDLPGHGFSSHFPPRVPLHTYNNLMAYRLVCQYFKKASYIMIGHSYGGQVATIFAQIYPDLVEKLVLLDTINLMPVPPNTFGDFLSGKIDEFLELDRKLRTGTGPPVYTRADALDRLQNNRRYSAITAEGAAALFERAVLPATSSGDKMYFTLDPRLKVWVNPTRDFRYTIESLKYYPIRCPVLIVLAKGSSAQEVYFMPILKKFRAMKNVRIVKVEGTHDVHNDYPERVAPSIVKFLDQKVPPSRRAKL